MVESELRRLAEHGVARFPPSAIRRLSEDCRDLGRARPSIRFLLLADVLALVAELWEPHGAYSTEGCAALDSILARRLPSITNEPDDEAAGSLVTSMADEIRSVIALWPPT